jgi:hypothetical protein
MPNIAYHRIVENRVILYIFSTVGTADHDPQRR